MAATLAGHPLTPIHHPRSQVDRREDENNYTTTWSGGSSIYSPLSEPIYIYGLTCPMGPKKMSWFIMLPYTVEPPIKGTPNKGQKNIILEKTMHQKLAFSFSGI